MHPAITQILQVRVKPRARESSLAQLPDGTWVARVKSPPTDGRANHEVIALVAEHFGCAQGLVSIKSGASARLKLICVQKLRS